MPRRCIRPIGGVLATSATIVALAVTWGWAQTAAPATVTKAKADPKINEQFRKPNLKELIKRFESEDREIYARRHEIVAALDLAPGLAVADVGACTGLFTRLFAEKVGPSGRVYAVDIAP